MKDSAYMIKLWAKGADTVMLSELEMRKIKNIIENPEVFSTLEQVVDTIQGDVYLVLD